MSRYSIAALAVALLFATANVSSAVQVGFDDFGFVGGDGIFSGTPNGDFTSRVITPDNSANIILDSNGADVAGSFSGSRFDVFGITNRGVNFDFADDSAGTFVGDSEGILFTGKTDNVFGIADLENGNNIGGTGTATWVYDISGFSNLSLSLDMASIGDFELADSFVFTATIDGGNPQTLFDITANEGVTYTVTMESGDTYPGAANGFFNSAIWDELSTNGPFDNGGDAITYSSSDVDPQDGLDDTTGLRTYQEMNSFGTFTNDEFELFKDPLQINGTTDLTNQLTTYAAGITGSGSTLTLEFSAANNGSGEVFVFDNLLIEGDVGGGNNADVNNSGLVDGADLLLIQNGDPSAAGITIADFQAQYGTAGSSSASVGAVPEPSTLVMLGLGLVAMGMRRKAS
ncbi:PEP-CTERM sorting domain-containing protein [Adhaeretor mobilis]|nr:PEP-CTERM sorting domain-containing protein [Adhaeretor mobilis]